MNAYSFPVDLVQDGDTVLATSRLVKRLGRVPGRRAREVADALVEMFGYA